MNLVKKTALIFTGILIGFIILEISLQIAAFSLTLIKKHTYKKINLHDNVTVLCLGESTTANQWPATLQSILEKKGKHKKFKIIDEGKIGTNTFFILEDIDSYLEKYKPDCVILMIGINDRGIGYKKSKFKSVNLLQLIYSHVKNKYFYNYNDESFFILQDLAIRGANENKFNESEYILNFLMNKSDNYSENTAMILMCLYLAKSDKESLDKLKILINNYNGEITYRILHQLELFFLKQKDSGEKFKNWLLKHKNSLVADDIGTALILKKYNCSFLLNDIRKKRRYTDDILIKNKILNEEKILKYKKNNYIGILNKIYNYNKKIKIIPMQYPTLSVESLKKDLTRLKYYDKLIFIDNEKNFNKALKIYKTEDIFSDMFAGTFGHCTELGNTLIAENAAETILSLYDKE